jgi:cyclopropane fatty-acyl-phospholipid synthase-like methyltransferase
MFRRFPPSRRLFVLVRYLVVPWRKVVVAVPPSRVLIDVGSGDGLFLSLLRQRYPGLRCIGIEHDEKKIEACRKYLDPAIEILSWNDLAGRELPRADCVTATDVFYAIDLKDWGRVFEFARRCLAPKGVFVVKDCIDKPRWKMWITLVEEIFATQIARYTKGDMPHLHKVETFLEQFERHGFKCERHMRIDQWYPWSHYVLIARKI